MAILKRRPRIRLLAPVAVTAGRPFEVTVLLDCTQPVPASSVMLDLEGNLVWYQRGQHGRQRHLDPIHGARARVQLYGGGELGAGEHRFSGRLAVPVGVPTSYGGQTIQVEYRLKVRVDIPWWPDATAEFLLPVLAAPADPADRQAVFASSPDGPQGRKAYFELSTATTQLVPGGNLALAASLANSAHNRYRRLELDLVAIEQTHHWLGTHSHDRRVARFEVPLDEVGDGQAVRFAVRLPGNIVPAFRSERASLHWELRATLDVVLGFDPAVTIPVAIRMLELAEAPRAAPLPPAVGSERVELVWREVASAHGYQLVDDALACDIAGGGAARIWRETRGRRGGVLCAQLAIPDLGLGLALDGRGRLRARDGEQQKILRQDLGVIAEAASITEASDRHLRCERRGSGTRRAALSSFVGEVNALIAQLAVVRAALPPPVALAGEIADWQRAAAAAGGELEVAGPTIRGARDGAAWSIAVGWDGDDRPRERIVRVVPPAAVDARHHGQWVAGEPGDAGAELDRLCRGARSLLVGRDELVLALPVDGVSFDQVVGAVPALVDRAVELWRGPSAGVYR